MTNNAAERALRCVPLGRKAWLFCDSDRGGERAAVIYTLIHTASSTMSFRKPGSPTSWRALPINRLADSTNSCPGTGVPSSRPSPPDQTWAAARRVDTVQLTVDASVDAEALSRVLGVLARCQTRRLLISSADKIAPMDRQFCSKSLARRRLRFSQASVHSTTQRRGRTTKPFAASERLTISTVHLPTPRSASRSLSPA